jgi:hypothetical protein
MRPDRRARFESKIRSGSRRPTIHAGPVGVLHGSLGDDVFAQIQRDCRFTRRGFASGTPGLVGTGRDVPEYGSHASRWHAAGRVASGVEKFGAA